MAWLPPETETSTWDEYRILCADDEVRHGISRPTVRAFALDRILQQNKFRDCGPHRLEQRRVTRESGIWHPIEDSDIQTDTYENLVASFEVNACPKCHSPIGAHCTDLRASFAGRPIRYPHQERQALIPSTEHSANILHVQENPDA